MLTRRLFASCALCAATGLMATEAAGQSAAPAGVRRTILSQSDGPTEGYVSLMMLIEIDPSMKVMRHTHPGIESTYVVEGSFTLSVKGRPDQVLAAGAGVVIPPNVPHAVQNGDKLTRLAASYIVEKGKPLLSPAPE